MRFVKNPVLNPDWLKVGDYLADLLLISKEKRLSKLYTLQKFKVFGQLNPLEKCFKICYVYRKRKPT